MKGYRTVKVLSLLAPSVAPIGLAGAQDDGGGTTGVVLVRLVGFNEVPSVSSAARGTFSAQIDEAASTITYTLQYDQLSGDVVQAHLHLGERHTNGGISIWLCSNLTDPAPPAGTPACPPGPAEVTGTITAEQVTGPVDQGIDAGEFEEVLAAIRAGAVYANVHSSTFPAGEIRGQLFGQFDDHDESDEQGANGNGGAGGGMGGGPGGAGGAGGNALPPGY